MRLLDWQSRLANVIEARMDAPFAWGIFDCCMFAADCAQACTGVDPAASWRGRYATAKGAARLLKKLGGVAGVADASGFREIAPVMAHPGDIGLVLNPGRQGEEALAVFGGNLWHAPGADGLIVLHEVLRAWRVD